MKSPTLTDTVARLQREAEDAAGLEPLPEFPEANDRPLGSHELSISGGASPAGYKADADGFNVRPSDRCATPVPAPWGATCTLAEFHAGAHSWQPVGEKRDDTYADEYGNDDVARATGGVQTMGEPAMLPGMPEPATIDVPEPEPDDYDVPYEAQFNRKDYMAAPGIAAIAWRHIAETKEFAHLKGIEVRFFWKRRGGLKGGNPRYGALMRPTGLAAYALGGPVYALWLAADHIRDAKWIPRQFDAQIFDLLAHSAVDPDDHSAYRILGDDFAGMSLTLEHYGLWQADLREAAGRLRQLPIEQEVVLPDEAADDDDPVQGAEASGDGEGED